MKHRNRLFWLILLVAGVFLIYSTESPLPFASRETVKAGIAPTRRKSSTGARPRV